MIYGLWLSSAGMQVNQYRQAVIANNLANTETAAFKRDLGIVSEREVESRLGGGLLAEHRLLDALTGGSFVRPTYTDYSDGPLTPSANPLDVALPGNRFLVVRDADQLRYTKDGRLSLDKDGRLVMATGGRAVLDVNDRPILTAPGETGRVSIAPDGTVRQAETALGRLRVVAFDDLGSLVKRGAGLFDAAGQRPVDSDKGVVTGAVEASNVSPIASLASMIEVTRAYQLNASMLSMQDETLGRAVNDIARLA